MHHKYQQTKEFLDTFYRVNTFDRFSILLSLARRLIRCIASTRPRMPYPYNLAFTHILIFFAYILLLDIDARSSWTIIFVIYAASLSTTVFLCSLARVRFPRFSPEES